MAKFRTIKEAEKEIRALQRARKATVSTWKARATEGAIGLGGDAAAGFSSFGIGMYTAKVELEKGPERASVVETRLDLGVTVVGAVLGAVLPAPYSELVGAMRHASEGALTRKFGKSLVYQSASKAVGQPEAKAKPFGAPHANGVVDDGNPQEIFNETDNVWAQVGQAFGFGG